VQSLRTKSAARNTLGTSSHPSTLLPSSNPQKSYTGFSPASSPKTIQRQWPDYNPTMTITDKKVMCNGGTSADLSAKIAAGSKIKAIWSQWTHEQGPVMVWMYKCAGDFKSCDGSGKKWFKVRHSNPQLSTLHNPCISCLPKFG
jgi:hypothetical protein